MTTFNLGPTGGSSFSFENPGDSITGTVVTLEEVQQTDMSTGEPLFWNNGQPKMMFRLELQTQLRDPNNPSDDGKRSVYLKGSRKPEKKSTMSAVSQAVKAATGGYDIATGGTFTITYIGDGVPSQRGFNAPKQYEATYRPPAMNLAGGQQPAAPATPAAPAVQAPAAPAAPSVQAPATAPAVAPTLPAGITPEMLAAAQAAANGNTAA